jgi:uncharacterized membrane-anchored protein
MQDIAVKRVPHIIFSYWIIKIASTTLGETGADMFSMTFNLGYEYTILIFLAVFLILLAFKMVLGRYTPTSYWLVFTATAILGTGVSDFMDRTLQLGYADGSLILSTALLITLVVWYLSERSLSVEYIPTARAELFYWAAFLVANTLGTAAGDFLSDGLGLGFSDSAMLITGLLFATAMAHYFTRISGVLLFWVAFVLTRPFGATFGDLLTKPVNHGGMDLGTIGASVFFAMIMFTALLREARMERVKAD